MGDYSNARKTHIFRKLRFYAEITLLKYNGHLAK